MPVLLYCLSYESAAVETSKAPTECSGRCGKWQTMPVCCDGLKPVRQSQVHPHHTCECVVVWLSFISTDGLSKFWQHASQQSGAA